MREIDGQIEKVECWSSVGGILVLIWNVNTLTENHKIFRHQRILFLPRAAEAANCCCRAAWSALCPAVSCCCCCCCTAAGCWAACVPPRPGTANPGRIPRLLRITRLPSSAAVLAACTTSLGWAFLHSTWYRKMVSLGRVYRVKVSLTFLFLIVWKWISQTLSTVSSCSKVTKPKPRCLLVCWSINMTASSTLPATQGSLVTITTSFAALGS